MDLHLAGLRALVSGGTRGIGRAVVATLLAEGAQVAFCARDADAVAATAAELGAGGGTVIGSVADVSDGAAVAGEPCDRRLGLPCPEGLELVVPFAHQHQRIHRIGTHGSIAERLGRRLQRLEDRHAGAGIRAQDHDRDREPRVAAARPGPE